MKKIIILWVACCIAFTAGAQILTKVDSIKFTQTNIWGVLSDDGDSLCATTEFTPALKPHIFMRKINYNNIHQTGPLVQLTFDADFVSISKLTDHKNIIFNNQIYVAFSTQGDSDLFLFKTDINGNRIGAIASVVNGSSNPTNDMILTTDSSYIYVMHFLPPNQHKVYKYDFNLNFISSYSTTTLNHNNLGGCIYHNNELCMFTGSNFGFNSNLVLTKWTTNWTPAIGATQNLVNTSSGDGNWFSTGITYDSLNQRWYIGMSHITSGQTIGQEHIDLLAFDNNFNLLERHHITSPGFFRTHFVLKGNYLYLTFDKSGGGVYLLKYAVQQVAEIKENFLIQNNIYPNPTKGNLTISFANSAQGKVSVKIMSAIGQEVYSEAFTRTSENHNIDLSKYENGIYLVQITTNNTTTVKHIVKN